jgi:hypothetical protein
VRELDLVSFSLKRRSEVGIEAEGRHLFMENAMLNTVVSWV